MGYLKVVMFFSEVLNCWKCRFFKIQEIFWRHAMNKYGLWGWWGHFWRKYSTNLHAMLRPQSLFSFNGKRKNDFISDFVFWDIHLLVFWVQRAQTDVLDEGDVVRWMPVQAVPELGEGGPVHHSVDGADHLRSQDQDDEDEDQHIDEEKSPPETVETKSDDEEKWAARVWWDVRRWWRAAAYIKFLLLYTNFPLLILILPHFWLYSSIN